MYWSVDEGQLNLMTDNVDHKEASVDLSGWTWRDAGTARGPFSVSFIGKSPSRGDSSDANNHNLRIQMI